MRDGTLGPRRTSFQQSGAGTCIPMRPFVFGLGSQSMMNCLIPANKEYIHMDGPVEENMP